MIAALAALHFQSQSTEGLRRLEDFEWQQLLDWCDARQLTFLLPFICSDSLPSAVSRRISECRNRHTERFVRLKRELAEIAQTLNAAGLNFVLLKGLTHSPRLTPEPLMRMQGDIDLWLKSDSVCRARDILAELGYIPLQGSKCRHLPPMARRSEWKWRGDRFDPDMPISVELHYELWSSEAEYFGFPELDRFWDRTQIRVFDGYPIRVLQDEDLLGFAALHLLLHVLHGELPMQRAWEIANFLHREARNDAFWNSWKKFHSGALRQSEVLIFELVHRWLGCELPPAVQEELSGLPEGVGVWLRHYSFSPLKSQFQPNKDDLWLHLALVKSRWRQVCVLTRRLAPMCIPGFADRANEGSRLFRMFRQKKLLFSRMRHHVSALLPTLYQGFRWMWLSR